MPATDAQDDQVVFRHKPVDPARHRGMALVVCLTARNYGTRPAPKANQAPPAITVKVPGKVEDADQLRTCETGETGGCGESGEQAWARQRNLNAVLSIFNALIRWSSVEGGTPSFAAAPDRPATRPRHAASAATIISRSLRGSP